MRLALLVAAAGVSCLAAMCDSNRPAPNPVPTIPTVMVTPAPPNPEAGTQCAVACEQRHSEGCPKSGHAPKPLDHCVSMCTQSQLRPIDPSPDCMALVFTCDERCDP